MSMTVSLSTDAWKKEHERFEQEAKDVAAFLREGWPQELIDRSEASFRPIPKPFKRILGRHCSLVASNRWNVFAVKNDVTAAEGYSTPEPVIRALQRFLFPEESVDVDPQKGFRKCVEYMLANSDEVYFEFFGHFTT